MVYILRNENFPVFLVSAYAKNEREDLSQQERNRLAQLANEVFSRYGI